MDQGPPKIEIQRIPLKERNLLQYFMIKLFDKVGENKTNRAWFEAISNIIDNTENKNIRDLIMSGEYENAANLVNEKLKILKQNDDEQYVKAA